MPEIILTILHQSTLATVSALYPDFPRNMRPLSWRRDAGFIASLLKCGQNQPLIGLDAKKVQQIAKLDCVNCFVIFSRCANCEIIGLCLDPETGGWRAETARDPIMPG